VKTNIRMPRKNGKMFLSS